MKKIALPLFLLLAFIGGLLGCPPQPIPPTTDYGDAAVINVESGEKVGSFKPTPTGTGFVHITAGSQDTASKLVENADVHASAAIAGSKISPDFGAQNVTTSGGFTTAGNLLCGATPRASTGTIRMPNTGTIYERNNGNSGDVKVLTVDSSDRVVLGENAASNGYVMLGVDTTLASVSGQISVASAANQPVVFTVGGTEKFRVSTIGPTAADPATNGFRCSFTTAVPVTTADVSNATTVYLTPYKSGAIALYDGTRWVRHISTEVSLALGTLTSGKNYDVFAYSSSGTVTLEFSAAWTNDTTRADAISRQDGVYVKTGTTTRRYVCSFRTTSTTQTQDTLLQRYLFNMDNRVARAMSVSETTSTWNWNTTGTWHQANAAAGNQVEYINGDPGGEVMLDAIAYTACKQTNVGASGQCGPGIGINSTTASSHTAGGSNSDSTDSSTGQVVTSTATALYRGYPRMGYNQVAWLERTNINPTVFYSAAAGNVMRSGLVATVVQ